MDQGKREDKAMTVGELREVLARVNADLEVRLVDWDHPVTLPVRSAEVKATTTGNEVRLNVFWD
jgi:hypothetical protein